MKTAEHIFDKIKKGDYDPSRDGSGVKLGSSATPTVAANTARKPGCCG